MTIFEAFGLDKNVEVLNIVPHKDTGSIKIIKSFPALKDIRPAEFVDDNNDLFVDDPSIRTDPNGINQSVLEAKAN